MIGRLRGRVLEARPGLVLLDVGGVGYELHVSVATFAEVEQASHRAAPDRGVDEAEDTAAELTLHVHTHVREDAIQLFGFWTRGERELFLRLVAVSGIGPKLAQTILSGMPPHDLADAIARGDARRLVSIPGVGKKTAERMVLELKDTVADLAIAPAAAATPANDDGDLVEALLGLGYKRAAAERAVTRVAADHPDAPLADRLRQALKLLSPR
ncbi:MAG: Holliday junction branch migration protein RuvA [Acidobacteriota bacterium]